MSNADDGAARRAPRWLSHLVWAVPLALVLVIVIWSLSAAQRDGNAQTRAAEDSARTLVERFTRGEPDAVAQLVGDNTNTSLLSPAAAKVAFGDNPSVEVVSSWQPEHSERVEVGLRIKTAVGEIPVAMSMSPAGTRDAPSFTAARIETPQLNTASAIEVDPATIKLKVNGVEITADALRTQVRVFPGQLVVEAPSSPVFSLGNKPGEPLLDVALLGQLGASFDPPQVPLYITPSQTEEFTAAAGAAIDTWAKQCTGPADKIPAACVDRRSIAPPVRGAEVRNVTWRHVPEEDDRNQRWIGALRDVDFDAKEVPVRYVFLSMRAEGQWLDGSTWRRLSSANSVSLDGTLRRAGDGWTFTPAPPKEDS